MAAHPPTTPIDPHQVSDDIAHAAGVEAAHGAEHAGGSAFPPFDASLFASQLIWFAITFALLYFVVSRFVLPRVSSVLERRAGAVKNDLDQAAQKSADAEEARVTMERAMAKARADARAMVEAARADITAKLNAEQEAAEKRLAERIAAAESRVGAARQKALAEVPALAEALAREIADKLAPSPAPAPLQRVAGEA
jgi:F-type H+-transporting ATPase subunit b